MSSHWYLVLPFKFIKLYLGREKWPLHLETRTKIQEIWNAILPNNSKRMYRFIPFCHWSVSISFKHFAGHLLKWTDLVVNSKSNLIYFKFPYFPTFLILKIWKCCTFKILNSIYQNIDWIDFLFQSAYNIIDKNGVIFYDRLKWPFNTFETTHKSIFIQNLKVKKTAFYISILF